MQGADGANYDIGWSGLSTAIQGADLERLQITAGKLITVGATFSRGKREKPVHIKFEDDYGERLDYLSEQLIVLHDTEVRIAWLVDGLSALLHLVKANLRYRHRKQPQINSGTTPSPELNKFRTADGSSGQQMALETLENTRNLTIPLRRKAVAAAGTENSEEDAPFYCVKDLVKYIMHALEQIIDKEADERADSDATWHLRGPRAFGTLAQKQVVGYDFMAIAAKRHPFHPVGATIQSGGGDWAEVIRQIHAPILFGKQFGELMEPIRNNEHGGCCEKCSWNINVPPHRDILAVAMSELDAIIERGGRKLDNRWCLVQKFYFDFSPELFVRCEKNKRGQCHQQRIQGG